MTSSLRIFIVEDEALLQMQLEMFLEDAGHEVVGFAASSRDAIHRAKDAAPDVALVDIHLADGPTGVEVGKRLVEEGTSVVFMTANAKRIPEDFCGAIGIINKPYTQAGVANALTFLMSVVHSPPPGGPAPHSLVLAPAMAARWGLG